MIVELLIQFILGIVGLLYVPVAGFLSPLRGFIETGIGAVSGFVEWAVSGAAYFIDPLVLRVAFLYVPAYLAAYFMISIIKYVINVVRGAGA